MQKSTFTWKNSNIKKRQSLFFSLPSVFSTRSSLLLSACCFQTKTSQRFTSPPPLRISSLSRQHSEHCAEFRALQALVRLRGFHGLRPRAFAASPRTRVESAAAERCEREVVLPALLRRFIDPMGNTEQEQEVPPHRPLRPPPPPLPLPSPDHSGETQYVC